MQLQTTEQKQQRFEEDAARKFVQVYSSTPAHVGARVLYNQQDNAFLYVGERCVACCLYGDRVKRMLREDA